MYARCVLRLLTIDQKCMRKDISDQCLTMLKRSARLLSSIRDCRRDLDPSLHTRPTVKAVSSAYWKCAEKGEDRFTGREGDGHCFLGWLRNHPHELFPEGSNNHRGILCNTAKPFARQTVNGTSEIGAQEIRLHHNTDRQDRILHKKPFL